MENKSYKIKHDYLFAFEDTNEDIQPLDDSTKDCTILPLSKIMKIDNEIKFVKTLCLIYNNVLVVDDIDKCINPSSEKYKQFIIRCLYRKLRSLNYNVFVQLTT